MEVDNWLFDINAAQNTLFNVLPHQLHWFFTNLFGIWRQPTGKVVDCDWTGSRRENHGWVMKVASGTYHETVCLHMIALYFRLFLGGGESASQLWSDSYPTWQETIQFSQQGTVASDLEVLILIWASSDSPACRLTADCTDRAKWSQKKISYTRFFVVFCSAPPNEVIKHLSQDQKTGCKECCSVAENCVPPVIISWPVLFFLNRREKVWWQDVLHNSMNEKREPTTSSASR